MAKSGTDKFTTTVILTAKCGTKVSAALFMKKMGDAGYSSVETFLNDNESKILSKSFGKQQKNRLFPKSDKSINCEEWDLQMYCFLLLEICCLNNTEYKAIDYLREKRNKLSHLSDPSLNDEQYEEYTKRIRNIIEDLLEIINDEQLKGKVMYDFETALRSGNSEFQDEFVKILHNWYSDIHSKLDEVGNNIETSISGVGNGIKGLGDGVNGLTIGQQTVMTKLEYAISLLESEDATPVKIPGTEIQILVKNCSSEKEKVICKVLADLFKERIRNEPTLKADLAGLSEQTVDNLRVVVAEVFQELVSKGIKIIDAEQKCVLLKVDCTSFKALQELINECANKIMVVHFQSVEKVVTAIPGCKSCLLQVVITEDEFWKCIDKLVSEVVERSQLSRRNTNRGQKSMAVSKDTETESIRLQLTCESLQAESENEIIRSELKKMETTIQREFDLPSISLERKILEDEILTEASRKERQHPVRNTDLQMLYEEIIIKQHEARIKVLHRSRIVTQSLIKESPTAKLQALSESMELDIKEHESSMKEISSDGFFKQYRPTTLQMLNEEMEMELKLKEQEAGMEALQLRPQTTTQSPIKEKPLKLQTFDQKMEQTEELYKAEKEALQFWPWTKTKSPIKETPEKPQTFAGEIEQTEEIHETKMEGTRLAKTLDKQLEELKLEQEELDKLLTGLKVFPRPTEGQSLFIERQPAKLQTFDERMVLIKRTNETRKKALQHPTETQSLIRERQPAKLQTSDERMELTKRTYEARKKEKADDAV